MDNKKTDLTNLSKKDKDLMFVTGSPAEIVEKIIFDYEDDKEFARQLFATALRENDNFAYSLKEFEDLSLIVDYYGYFLELNRSELIDFCLENNAIASTYDLHEYALELSEEQLLKMKKIIIERYDIAELASLIYALGEKQSKIDTKDLNDKFSSSFLKKNLERSDLNWSTALIRDNPQYFDANNLILTFINAKEEELLEGILYEFANAKEATEKPKIKNSTIKALEEFIFSAKNIYLKLNYVYFNKNANIDFKEFYQELLNEKEKLEEKIKNAKDEKAKAKLTSELVEMNNHIKFFKEDFKDKLSADKNNGLGV